MARYSKSASKDVKGAMERRKAGSLKTGKSGKTVKGKEQAIAIGFFEARAKGEKVPGKKSAESHERPIAPLMPPTLRGCVRRPTFYDFRALARLPVGVIVLSAISH